MMPSIMRRSPPDSPDSKSGSTGVFPLSGWRYAAVICAYGLLFLGFFFLARYFRQQFEGSLWYPAAGLRLALLFLFGARMVPGLIAADLLAVVLFGWLVPESRYQNLLSVALVGLAPILYALGVAVMRRLGRIDLALRRVRDVAWVTASILVVPLFAAAASRTVNVVLGLLPAETLVSATLSFWIGDAIGALMLTPLLLIIHRCRRGKLETIRWGTLVIDSAAVWATFLFLHRVPSWLGGAASEVYWYLAFVPIIWITFRHGLVGAVAGVLAMTSGTAWLSILPARSIAFHELQILVVFLSASALLMGATVTSRDAAEETLRRQNDELEAARGEVEEKNEELRRRNDEMERFVYTASHDLKSPLITINGFLGFLKEDLKAGDHNRVGKDVERICTATATMKDLLDDLLELSRVGRVVNAREPVALGEVADRATGLLAGHLTARGVDLEIDSGLPTVLGDPMRLLQVFQNLIENAIKFMGDEAEPRIEVGFTRDDDEAIIHVRDNGIGINPRHHERIFGLFDQLQEIDDGGTGIGLALVKRIIEEHDGRIWVESNGNNGSTFYFTLPRGA